MFMYESYIKVIYQGHIWTSILYIINYCCIIILNVSSFEIHFNNAVRHVPPFIICTKQVDLALEKLIRYSDWLGAGRPGIDSRQGQDFPLLHSDQASCGTHQASYPMVSGTDYMGVKPQEREAYYSPPSSAEVKNAGDIPPLPHASSWSGA
jgi:hypothetical protein